MGLLGSGRIKGVVSSRWVKEGESVGSDGGGVAENIMVASLWRTSVESLGKESYGGEKKIFPAESGKYPGGGGKKPTSDPRDNCTGHCSNAKDLFFATNVRRMNKV